MKNKQKINISISIQSKFNKKWGFHHTKNMIKSKIMKILLAVIFIYTVIITFLAWHLARKGILLAAEQQEFENHIKLAKDKINSARYGNFQIKLDEKEDKSGLYKSLNNLFESIVDRDLVINEYREKDRENFNLKEEFIATLTHDLKVPIIAQDKTFDLLLAGKFGELSQNQLDVIKKLKESNMELKSMTQAVLEAYKTELGGIELNIEKNTNVNDFIKKIIENIKNLYDRQINLFVPKEEITADFDPMLIEKVINNLILNAIKYTENSKIDIHLNKISDTFSLDVIDYGEGIDEEGIKKIFNKYYSMPVKGSSITTGLGLYLSNKIIKKHKGIIEVESKKGEGSIFRIILPI